jgi:hypothetical protein
MNINDDMGDIQWIREWEERIESLGGNLISKGLTI